MNSDKPPITYSAQINIPKATAESDYQCSHSHGETTLKIWPEGNGGDRTQDAAYVLRHSDRKFEQTELVVGTKRYDAEYMRQPGLLVMTWLGAEGEDGRAIIEREANNYLDALEAARDLAAANAVESSSASFAMAVIDTVPAPTPVIDMPAHPEAS